MRRLARALSSDLAMAASVMLAVQLFGLLAVLNVIHSLA
jgi:hypothetical protein